MTTREKEDLATIAGYEPLRDQLLAVETRLSSALNQPPRLLTESARHLMMAGGKRIRPALTVICANMIAPGCPEAIEAAVACELVHLGSLHHDDVIDEAISRRGVLSVNANWSNSIAVLSGDFLLARASQIAAGLGATPAAVLADTIAQLASGEILEIQSRHDKTIPIETYLEVIFGKTAALMGTACRLGALVAGGDNAVVERAERFGIEVGMAFQIVDDVLDIVAAEAESGKRRGIDIAEGVYTLPILLALQADPAGSLHELLKENPTETEIATAVDLITDLGGVRQALDAAAKRLDRSEEILESFPACQARDALIRLARYVVERVGLNSITA